MFSGRHVLPQIEGRVFVDRNPKVFMLVLDYLSNGLQLPTKLEEFELEQLKMELDFWSISSTPLEEETDPYT